LTSKVASRQASLPSLPHGWIRWIDVAANPAVKSRLPLALTPAPQTPAEDQRCKIDFLAFPGEWRGMTSDSKQMVKVTL
jgi:hypothetical protein